MFCLLWIVLFCSVLFCSFPFCSVLFCSVLFCRLNQQIKLTEIKIHVTWKQVKIAIWKIELFAEIFTVRIEETKITLIQYLDIKAQISDKIQSLENYEISTVVFDNILLSKPASNIDSFTRRRHIFIDIHYQTENYFISQKVRLVKILIYMFHLNKL